MTLHYFIAIHQQILDTSLDSASHVFQDIKVRIRQFRILASSIH